MVSSLLVNSDSQSGCILNSFNIVTPSWLYEIVLQIDAYIPSGGRCVLGPVTLSVLNNENIRVCTYPLIVACTVSTLRHVQHPCRLRS
jgi:hypothetical protein